MWKKIKCRKCCHIWGSVQWKKPEWTLGLLSHCGAVSKGLTNCAPQVKEEPGTDCSPVLQLVLIAVALDAVCFVFHLFLCWDWILYSLRLCFAPYMLGDEIPLSCDSKPDIMDYKSGKKQSHPTQLLDKTGSEEYPVHHCSPVHKGYLSYLSINSCLLVSNWFSWEESIFS